MDVSTLETFQQYQSLLFGIAYRMLGTIMDAEDMVQETFLRWQRASNNQVQSPKRYLTTIVTRLCIDRLRSAQVKREQYIGPWLPEPIVTSAADPAAKAEQADSLSMAFLVLLERLSPIERAVFLLREIFDYDYNTIGLIVEKSPSNCRQIARRAKQRIHDVRSRFSTSPHQREEITQQFLRACEQGDLQGLLNLLADDITLYSDGGGKVVAALKPLHRNVKVARFLLAINRRQQRLGLYSEAQFIQVNSQSGLLYTTANTIDSVMAFDVAQGHIQTLYFVRNPEKLRQASTDRDFASRTTLEASNRRK
ncbi:ECF RNA polymerase sigma factor SigJ [Acaryochloris thomasi RCC1774]|uniref:ECF RNA polymerase sigma factor SigJ n=1 Tax=Acaryochloris thomasi RCC1774 TaxID=1764569 RepID=A0A2W1JLJ9_9CYAN|nr:RNA polymerase sigma-70 factor [Acaryochloris thomasi]PZD71782.1 ECF RNA polymerase sigma factor SigJ [Acaryochloris thomasi RCC1774]